MVDENCAVSQKFTDLTGGHVIPSEILPAVEGGQNPRVTCIYRVIINTDAPTQPGKARRGNQLMFSSTFEFNHSNPPSWTYVSRGNTGDIETSTTPHSFVTRCIPLVVNCTVILYQLRSTLHVVICTANPGLPLHRPN